MSESFPTKIDAEAWARQRSSTIAMARRVSMLGEPALALMSKLAESANGPIIELGPYIGGSTIALASHARDRVVTVEIGGSNVFHDTLPSKNIVTDLRRNLERAGLSDRVSIVEGHFRNAAVVSQVEKALSGRRAKLLCVDLLPGTEVALGLYARFLEDDAFIVVDDYHSDIASDKAKLVSGFVDKAVGSGVLEEIGVFGWGTWFGKLAARGGREKLIALRAPVPCVHESGYAWQIYVGHDDLADDKTMNGSPLELLEDRTPLSPGHSLHCEIREKGGGRYSHWSGNLWFSSSDNSDPRTNGRRYSIRVHTYEVELCEPVPFPA